MPLAVTPNDSRWVVVWRKPEDVMTRVGAMVSLYGRILLRMSGEALQGAAGYGIDRAALDYVAHPVQLMLSAGVQLAIAVGGGNIWRGEERASTVGIDRATAD